MTKYIAALWKAGELSDLKDQPVIVTAECLRQAAKDHPELEFNEDDKTLYATKECRGNINLEIVLREPLQSFSFDTLTLPPQDIETCHVVDQFCEAPANLDPPDAAKYECVSCGQPVCGKCSSLRKYKDRQLRQRICNDCQIEILDGNDRIVMARIRRLAGYKANNA